MSDHVNETLWLIGTGPMAVQYARVLDGLHVRFETIGRSAARAAEFEKATGHQAKAGGIEAALVSSPAPRRAIVAVSIEQLQPVTQTLIEAGTTSVLVEKPAGLDGDQIRHLLKCSTARNADVRVAYNRRFYASTRLLRKKISEDGGLSSVRFTFTERSHLIESLTKAPGVKENWFLGNSSHVADLFCYLAGRPDRWSASTSGSLPWHSRSARFSGAGITCNGVLFSYHADWTAPGSWSLEAMTPLARYVMQPMEGLSCQTKGSPTLEPLTLDDDLDTRYKPGLFLETEEFLSGKFSFLPSLQEHVTNLSVYEEIANYARSSNSHDAATTERKS